MKTLLLITIFLASAINSFAQDCPPDKVCLDREQAIEYLSLKDVNDALKKEIATLQQAIDGHKAIIVDLKVELARISGEKSQLEADRVRTNAIMDILIKQARPKKVGLINLF